MCERYNCQGHFSEWTGNGQDQNPSIHFVHWVKDAKNIDTNLAIATKVNGITKAEIEYEPDDFQCFSTGFFHLRHHDSDAGGYYYHRHTFGVGELRAGDTVEVEIEKIGILKNTVMRLA